MRILAAPLLLALLGTVLAGCSDSPAPNGGTGEPEPEFNVEATETTGVIRGLVIDDAIRPLAGVTINVTSGGPGAVTGDDGAFGFQGLAPGTHFLSASKAGYNSVQSAVDVVAGESEPAITKLFLTALASMDPYVETLNYAGFLTFGAAVGITSLGSTFLGGIGDDYAIWNVQTPQVPTWLQGELVWDQTQPAGGMLIWEIVEGNGQNIFHGHRETSESPALAYWNTTEIQAVNASVLEYGVDYRFFAGPHPATGPGFPLPEEQCPIIPTVVLGDRNPCRFGFGAAVQQRTDAYIHNFYNFAPPEGWRFTVNGAPVVPAKS